MPLELTEARSKAIEQAADASPSITDPRTRKTYVLISMDVFQRIRSLVGADGDLLADTYPAQIDSAMKAGWDDPLMVDYNDYDAHRKS